MDARATGMAILRYVGHGLGLLVLTMAMGFLWPLLLAWLDPLGVVIGLVTGIVVWSLLLGATNTALTTTLWFRMVLTAPAFLAHGFLLFLALLLLNVPVFLAQGVIDTGGGSSPDLLIVAIAALSAPQGIIGKIVAARWEAEPARGAIPPPEARPAPKAEPKNPQGHLCPYCRGNRLVVASDRSAFCLDCRRGILPEKLVRGPV